jgi:hypothetical protein
MARRRPDTRYRWLRGLFLIIGSVLVAVLVYRSSENRPLELASGLATVMMFILGVLDLITRRIDYHRQSISKPSQVDEAARMLADHVEEQLRAQAHHQQISSRSPLRIRWRRPQGQPAAIAPHLLQVWPLEGDLDGLVGLLRAGGQRVLILGEAGTGKTSAATLVSLGLLADRAGPEPVPVVLPLRDWQPRTGRKRRRRRRSGDVERLREWIARRMKSDCYALDDFGSYGRTAASDLLTRRRVLPVLDGLDELPLARQHEVLRQLGQLQVDVPFVLTCRTEDFRRVLERTAPPAGMVSVELTSLDPLHAVGYLADAGGWTGSQRAAVEQRVRAERGAGALCAALSTPLIVSLAMVVYRQHSAPGARESSQREPVELAEVTSLPSREDIEHHLLREFVPTVFARNHDRAINDDWDPSAPASRHDSVPRPWAPDKAGRWLRRLAGLMHRRRTQTLSWWEVPGTDWLWGPPVRRSLRLRPWSWSRQGTALLEWLGGGAVVGLMLYWLAPVVFWRLIEWSWSRRYDQDRWRAAREHASAEMAGQIRDAVLSIGGPAVAVSAAAGLLIVGALVRANVAWYVPGRTYRETSQLESLRHDRSAALSRAALMATSTVLGLLGVWIGLAWINDHTATALRASGLEPVWPHGGLAAAATAAIPVLSIAFAVLFVAWCSASAWAGFVVSRSGLALVGRTPWRLMTFLEDAARLNVLRRTSDGYQFRHARLAESIAQADGSPRTELRDLLAARGSHTRGVELADPAQIRVQLAWLHEREGRFTSARRVWEQAIAAEVPGALSGLAGMLGRRSAQVARSGPFRIGRCFYYLVLAFDAWYDAVKAEEHLARTGLARMLTREANDDHGWGFADRMTRAVRCYLAGARWLEALDAGEPTAATELQAFTRQWSESTIHRWPGRVLRGLCVDVLENRVAAAARRQEARTDQPNEQPADVNRV